MGGCDRGAEKPCEGDAFSDGSAVVAGAAGILPQGGGYSARFAEDELVGCGWRCVEAALYAEYAIDFAALAMRYALLATATALDMQYEEERNKDE